MKKHIAPVLALLLLLFAPSAFAQYGEGGTGTGTFTVPTLTVNGTLTAGSFVSTGSVLIPDGAVGAPGLGFVDEPTTGLFQEAAGELNLTSLGVEVVEVRNSGAFYMLNPANSGGSSLGFETAPSASANILYGHTPGVVNPSFSLFINNTTGINLQMDDTVANYVTLTDGSGAGTTNNGFRFTDQSGAQYIEIVPPGIPSGTNTITVPDLTGTMILSGATNVETGTTTIASDTALNLHSTLAVTIDGDSDNNNTGAVTLTNDNDTQQVLLTTTGVSVASDNTVTLAADDATSNSSLTLDGPGNGGTLSVSDGTDTADIRMGPTSITIDADVDDDADGTVTLAAANSTSQVVVDSTGVAVTNYLFLDSVAHAALGTPANGALIYCSDCDAASNPCTTGGGSVGAMASRVAGAWICN